MAQFHLKTVDILFLVSILFIIRRLSSRKKTMPLPPGPKRLPLIGNILDMPSSHAWTTFAEWSKKWGDVVSVSIFGQNLIILNSFETAIELLDGRSQIYSDRPVIPFGGEMVGWNRTLGLVPYGKRFRDHRKYLHRTIGSHAAVSKFADAVIERETLRFLQRIVASSDALDADIKTLVGGVMLNISYGYKVQEHDDPLVELVETAMEQFGLSINPGGYLVNLIPALRHVPSWFPGGGFHKTAKMWRETMEDMADRPYHAVKDKMVKGSAQPSFTSALLEEQGISGEHEFDIKWVAASFYAGGTDTTSTGVSAFFLSMVLNPGSMKKAQQEIDSVVGNTRLPTLQDRANLPYVNALVKEVLRWHVIVPTSLPHRVSEDDVHNGYLIPKGSIVFANTWNMARNQRTYSEPELFKPERFLGPYPERDPIDFVFGFGRRRCPGRLLADATLFTAVARTLAVFNVEPVYKDGKEDLPVHMYMEGTVSHTHPFRCSLTPRFAETQQNLTSEQT